MEINPPLVKIQEIFPKRVANLVNKRVSMHKFVYKICKSRGKYFLYFKQKVEEFIYYMYKLSVFALFCHPKMI